MEQFRSIEGSTLEANLFKVTLDDQYLEVTEGTTVGSIFGKGNIKRQGIVAAILNQGMVGLETQIQGECLLQPVLLSQPLGRTVRRRTVAHMLLTLIANQPGNLNLVVGQSIGGGYFYEIEGQTGDLEALAADLTGAMLHLARAELTFQYMSVSLEAARRLLSDSSGSKAALLDTWPAPLLTLVRLGDFVDIPHGPYAPNTLVGEGAEVIPFKDGLLLDFHDSVHMPPAQKHSRLFDCYRQTVRWNTRLNIHSVGKLNKTILEDRESQIIRISEAHHEKHIAGIADEISNNGFSFVCIAGPSSSGKTTLMRRLSDQLQVNGLYTHMLSLDDYYRDRAECPMDEHGRYDFESPDALNLKLLHEHFEALLEGREIRLPYFNFKTGNTGESGKTLKLGEQEVVLLEGIHGNNPRVIERLPIYSRYRIFVNALNQIRIDDHNRILTSDIRLLRRLVRDRLSRATSSEQTILQWSSVLAGEKTHIYPFQDHTDVMFNSALIYEISALKVYAQRYLLEVPRQSPARVHAYRLLRFLDLFVPIFPNHIPSNSILREFIPGNN